MRMKGRWVVHPHVHGAPTYNPDMHHHRRGVQHEEKESLESCCAVADLDVGMPQAVK